MRRALVFAHYDPHGIVDEHVLYMLICYRQYFNIITFVSTAELNSEQQAIVKTIVDLVIVRSNFGYDFLSWRAGFEALPQLKTFEEVVFANDSCYGPCSDMSAFWTRAKLLDADLWGASINCQFRPHVQSFFMCFRSRLIQTGFLSDFWTQVEEIPDKRQLIMAYEVGLSSRVVESGFRIGGVVDLRNVDDGASARAIADNMSISDPVGSDRARENILAEEFPNPVQLYWAESLRRGLPFVKVELVRDNFLNANLGNLHSYLRAGHWYDVSLIVNHLSRTAYPCGSFPPASARTNASLRRDSVF